MLKKTRPALIGAFVIGAVVLFVAGIIVFGGGYFMKDTLNFVMYFEDSVKGLNVGAPVMFRGVKVGTVSDIRIRVDQKTGTVSIPVYVALDLGRVSRMGGTHSRQDAYRYIAKMVKEGLRAELDVQSFVTGQLTVQLDFFPNEPPHFTHPGGKIPELPTRASVLQRLSRSVDQLPLGDIAQRSANAIDQIVTLIQSPQFKQGTRDLSQSLHDLRDLLREGKESIGPVIENLQQTSKALRQLAEDLNARVDPMIDKVNNAADRTSALMTSVKKQIDTVGPKIGDAAGAVQKTVVDAGQFLHGQGPNIDNLIRNWSRTADATTATMQQAQATLQTLRQVAGAGSPIRIETEQAIREISRAAQALRSVADYLRRNPEALIQGRGKPRKGD